MIELRRWLSFHLRVRVESHRVATWHISGRDYDINCSKDVRLPDLVLPLLRGVVYTHRKRPMGDWGTLLATPLDVERSRVVLAGSAGVNQLTAYDEHALLQHPRLALFDEYVALHEEDDIGLLQLAEQFLLTLHGSAPPEGKCRKLATALGLRKILEGSSEGGA